MDNNRPYMDRLDDYDEDTGPGIAGCLRVLVDGLSDYSKRLLAVWSEAPTVDRPLVAAAMRLTYESLRANVPGIAEPVDELFKLPIATVLTRSVDEQ